MRAFFEWKKYHSNFKDDWNDAKYCKRIIVYLTQAKSQIKKLLKTNIEPSLTSFYALEQMSEISKYFKEKKNYQDTEFYKQFATRKKILNNLILHIEKNIAVTEEYINDYLPNNTFYSKIALCKEYVKMKDSLNLKEDEVQDLDYLYDAGLEKTFVLIIKKPVTSRNWKFCLYYLLYGLVSIVSIFSDDGEELNNYFSSKLKIIELSHILMYMKKFLYLQK